MSTTGPERTDAGEPTASDVAGRVDEAGFVRIVGATTGDGLAAGAVLARTLAALDRPFQVSLAPLAADAAFLLSYARGYRLTGRDGLWETAQAVADGLGIGDIGSAPGADVSLDPDAPGASPAEVFAMLELHRAAPHAAYLEPARRVADRLVERRYHHGFFLPSEDHVYARFDAVEPLAIVALDAALRGEAEQVPAYVGGSGYVHGRYDGRGRTRDSEVIWSVTRDEL